MSDYYLILGVDKNATQEDIKKAFRSLAHKHHPDKGGDEKRFKEINEAYQVLSNKEKREQYDNFGGTFEGQGTGDYGAGFDFGNFWQEARGGGVNFDIDIDDIFGDFFGFGKKKKARNKNLGHDIEVDLQIDLRDVLTGLQKSLVLNKMVGCSRCGGTGAEPGTNTKECFSCRGEGEVQQIKKTMFGTATRYTTCPECQGEGKIPEKPCNVCKGEGRIAINEEIKISVPAGIDTGQTIKITGAGEAGRKGAKSGDLYVRIFVKPSSIFQRKGDDLIVELPISFSKAALGDETDITLLDGRKISLKIPSGSSTGKILKISGKGLPHFSGWGKGDLYVELFVETPRKLTKKQKELLERLREEGL